MADDASSQQVSRVVETDALTPEVVVMGASCGSCSHCLLFDFGYSNWTVEGTTVVCMKRAHPEPEFDRFYGDDPRLRYAETCQHFDKGDPQSLDVDGDDWDELSDAGKRFIDEYRGTPYGKKRPAIGDEGEQ